VKGRRVPVLGHSRFFRALRIRCVHPGLKIRGWNGSCALASHPSNPKSGSLPSQIAQNRRNPGSPGAGDPASTCALSLRSIARLRMTLLEIQWGSYTDSERPIRLRYASLRAGSVPTKWRLQLWNRSSAL